MSIPRIAGALTYIDDELISAAAEGTKTKRVPRWLKWGLAAACLAAALIAGASVIPGRNSVPVSVGGIPRAYKNALVFEPEIAIDWPWEYMTVSERYGIVTYGGAEYDAKMMDRPIDVSFLGKSIGICDAIGRDPYTGREYRESFPVRQITGVSADLMIAVEMDEQFYLFKYAAYDPPATLGGVLDGYSLSQTLPLDRFETSGPGGESGYYSLPDDGYIWQVLAACRNAPFLEDDTWSPTGRDCISFTVTSAPLGVYKRVVHVSADGYVNTNIFDWRYTFDIGEEAAKEIISYARKNAAEAEREPYMGSLAGTLTEIGDGYILVDDAILCANKNDGMTFKIPTSDLRISRCLDLQEIKTGDFVVVFFTGDVDADRGNIVSGAVSMSRAAISEGIPLIPE